MGVTKVSRLWIGGEDSGDRNLFINYYFNLTAMFRCQDAT
jgi:hypothetical protein